MDAEEWNQEYADYLLAIDTKDYANMTIEELKEPVLSRTDYEEIQKKELKKKLSDQIQLIWTDVLNNVDGITHRWKYEYLDYQEMTEVMQKSGEERNEKIRRMSQERGQDSTDLGRDYFSRRLYSIQPSHCLYDV